MNPNHMSSLDGSAAHGLPFALSSPTELEASGMSIEQVLCMLRAHRRISVAIAAAVLALTVLLLAILPRTYTATAMLMVNYQVNDPVNGRELPVGQLSSYIATQVELLHTRDLLVEVVDRLKLTTDRHYAAGYSAGEGTLSEWAAANVNKKLDIRPSGTGSQLIYISFSAAKPELAANVVNAVADAYRDRERARETGAPEERAKRSDAELTALKARVEDTRRQLEAFQKDNGMIADDGKTDIDASALDNLEGRLLDAQNARRLAELRTQGDAGSSDQALSSSLVQNTRAQLAAKEQQLAQMSRTYGQAYPGLREVQQQVDDLRNTLTQVSQSYAVNANSSVAAARELEARLTRDVAAQRARVGAMGRLRIGASRLKLEFDSAQEAYKRALDSRGEATAVTAGKPYANIDIVSRATPPMSASAPKVLMIAAAGLMASLLLGLGLPLAYELLNRRVRCKDDIERSYGIPVLAEFRLPVRSARA